MANKLFSLWSNLDFRTKRFAKFGIPFFILVVGGSFGLEKFARIRYDYRKSNPVSAEECEKYGVTRKKPGEVTMETEFAKIETMDIDTWENIRGPRPWEEPAQTPPQKSVVTIPTSP